MKGLSPEAAVVLKANIARVLDSAELPCLTSGCECVLARAPATRTLLLGGLGALKVGEMWVPEQPGRPALVGHYSAPEQPEGSFYDLEADVWIPPAEVSAHGGMVMLNARQACWLLNRWRRRHNHAADDDGPD
jgi:hypothetical protein